MGPGRGYLDLLFGRDHRRTAKLTTPARTSDIIAEAAECVFTWCHSTCVCDL